MRDLQIIKLADAFGQYEILLTCACGHTRRCAPRALAALTSWDSKLADVVRRLRCSKCGERKCKARTYEMIKPRGLRDERR
jgi:hypothetical protein